MEIHKNIQTVESERQNLHHEENIVIVGAGIGGLTFAAALHRVGLKAVVLEQSDRLRAWGTSITLWTNGMRILELLGLANQFRSMYINILGREIFDLEGRSLSVLTYADCEGGPHESRCVERKVLLEALAGQLSPGTIRFNSRVKSLTTSQTSPGVTTLQLQDGSTYSAKVVVGYDGVHSVTGSWMGLEKPQTVGRLVTRGMALFPHGQVFEDRFHLYEDNEVIFAFIPMTSTKVYWFINNSGGSEDWRNNMTAELIKEEALKLTEVFQPPHVHLCINNTPLEHFVKNSLQYRLNTKPSDTQVVGTVTVAGDASHPSLPTLGQGGGMAMEDAIILTQKLFPVFKSEKIQASKAPKHEQINEALVEFHRERHIRTYSLTLRASKGIKSLQSNKTLINADNSALLNRNYIEPSLFDVGKLPM